MITRFAPSPTGPLHLGHAYSAMLAHDMALTMGGGFLLRIEDIDQGRARREWERQIYDDLNWLGLVWRAPVLRQSGRLRIYRAALRRLVRMDLIYPCRCRRRDIAHALSAPQEGVPLHGPDGLIYPGTCRHRPMSEQGPEDVLRLDIEKAVKLIGCPAFEETGPTRMGWHRLENLGMTVGDVILARRWIGGASYHLSVVVDDAAQAITHVIRGEDLFEATQIHVLLQRLLRLPTPVYHHHRLIRDETGKRLAKRDDARAIVKYRSEGATPGDIRRMVGLA